MTGTWKDIEKLEKDLWQKAVHKAQILIPTEPLITTFDEFAKPLFAQITNLEQQNQRLRDARDLLLPRLMTGELEL
jgi:type I restriction enzyme, S subunit